MRNHCGPRILSVLSGVGHPIQLVESIPAGLPVSMQVCIGTYSPLETAPFVSWRLAGLAGDKAREGLVHKRQLR